ncbi:TrkA family potassium uptake protein, partial [Candidatus Poribacteria bacterium]|nr:TrkA family potassium uptake protein [Candidatus Poribacteria bacterium]
MRPLKVAVIGLGRFGRALVESLTAGGAEVLAIDSDMQNVEAVKDTAAYAVRMDATDATALKGQGLAEVDIAVVAIGSDFESLVLTVQELLSLGTPRIYARAMSPTHRRVLDKLGIDGVISPQEEAAQRFAYTLVRPGLVDFLRLTDEYQIAEIEAPAGLIGRALADLDLVRRHRVNVVTIRRSQGGRTEVIGVPTASTTIVE